MYDVKKVAACLTGRVGFKSQTDIDLAVIDADLKESRSSLFWEDAHPLVDLEILQLISKDTPVEKYPAFVLSNSYTASDVVNNGTNTLYRALVDVPENTPLNDADFWAVTSVFSSWARNKIQASIKRLSSSFVKNKKIEKSTKTLMSDSQLFFGAGNYADKEIAQSRFVGFQLSFRDKQSLAATINRISGQFSEALEQPLTLYLYHTSSNDFLATFTINITKKLTVQWKDFTDLVLQAGTSYDIGGVYFLGYYEDDLPLGTQAINKSGFNFKTGPCHSCGGDNSEFRKWFDYLSVLPIAVPASSLQSDRTVFNWDNAQYSDVDKTFGLNLHITVKCDISAIICRQQQLFDEALSLQFAVDMLTEIANSIRINTIQEKTRQMALYQLDNRGESANRPQKGLTNQLLEMIESLDFDLSDIDQVCLPCSEKRTGINYTSI